MIIRREIVGGVGLGKDQVINHFAALDLEVKKIIGLIDDEPIDLKLKVLYDLEREGETEY